MVDVGRFPDDVESCSLPLGCCERERVMLIQSARLISSGFGSGYARKAQGTLGTVAGVCVWLLARHYHVCSPLGAAAVVSIVGFLAVAFAIGGQSEADPQWIVIDEWAGVFVALLAVDSTNLSHVFLAFVGFRLFDIVKPGPVRWAEDLPGAFGIMADDIVAGMLVFVGLLAYQSL